MRVALAAGACAAAIYAVLSSCLLYPVDAYVPRTTESGSWRFLSAAAAALFLGGGVTVRPLAACFSPAPCSAARSCPSNPPCWNSPPRLPPCFVAGLASPADAPRILDERAFGAGAGGWLAPVLLTGLYFRRSRRAGGPDFLQLDLQPFLLWPRSHGGRPGGRAAGVIPASCWPGAQGLLLLLWAAGGGA